MLGANAMIDTSASQRAQRGTKRPSGKTYMNSKIAPTPTKATTADGTSHARGRSNRWYGKVMPAQYIRSTSDTKNAIRSSGRRQKMIAPTAIGTTVKAASSETRGSSTVNRGQAAHSASSNHRGFLPRHLGSSAGGTGKINNSSSDQRWSVIPAAIAGVRSSPREWCFHKKL